MAIQSSFGPYRRCKSPDISPVSCNTFLCALPVSPVPLPVLFDDRSEDSCTSLHKPYNQEYQSTFFIFILRCETGIAVDIPILNTASDTGLAPSIPKYSNSGIRKKYHVLRSASNVAFSRRALNSVQGPHVENRLLFGIRTRGNSKFQIRQNHE